MDQQRHSESCLVFRTIDIADGVDDGKLCRSFAPAYAHRREQRIADSISTFAGSMVFVYIHIVWFGVWVAANVGWLGTSLVFDPFPFGLLTMVVSLEAIFLSTFILITQNRQGARSEMRAEFDFRNNVRGEIWAAHIGQALGLDSEHVENVVRETVEGYMADELGAREPERAG
jgi:uncharacterized membrane protein